MYYLCDSKQMGESHKRKQHYNNEIKWGNRLEQMTATQ